MDQDSKRPSAHPRQGPSEVDARPSDRSEHSTNAGPLQFPVIIARLQKNRREQLRIALDQFQGVDLIDLRVTVDLTESSGVQTPTKKGISIQVRQLPALLAALHDAEARARKLGLIHKEV